MSSSSTSISSISKILLGNIGILDSYGAKEWRLRVVTVVSAVVFLGIKKTIGDKRKIDWDALANAIITGIGSLICMYLDYDAAEYLTGVSEPLGTISCNGPLTSLHRILPAIIQGYAICDIINGFHLGPAFLAHGIATLSFSMIFNELGASQLITHALVMEGSTVFLAISFADFLTPTMKLIIQALFASSFFICRIVLFPYLFYGVATTMYSDLGDCFPRFCFYAIVVAGLFFNLLNTYWFFKLIKKIKKSLAGESVQLKDD